MGEAISYFVSVAEGVLGLKLDGVSVAYLLACVLAISLVIGAVVRTVSGGGGVPSVGLDRYKWSGWWERSRSDWGQDW